MPTEDLFGKSLAEVDKLIHEGTTLGEPVEINGCTIIPVFGYGFGFGAGYGGNEKNGQGGGTGAGGGVSPVALVVIDSKMEGIEGIRVIPVRKPGPVSEAISALGEEILPRVVEVIKNRNEEEEETAEKKE